MVRKRIQEFERRRSNVIYRKIIRKTRKSGAETETKALLYLMNLRKDSGRKIIWKVLLKRMQIF